jgi:hypothetical protein
MIAIAGAGDAAGEARASSKAAASPCALATSAIDGMTMIGRLFVVGGVVVGVLCSLLFSNVVAMGRAPGHRQPAHQNHHLPPKSDVLAAIKGQPPAPKYAPDCKEGADKAYECFLSWRSATAAEAQARYAYDQAQYALYGAVLVFLTLIATAAASIFAAISTRIANRTFKSGERAWVGPETVSTPYGLQIDREINAVVIIKNTGRTPALRMRARFEGYILGRQPAVAGHI